MKLKSDFVEMSLLERQVPKLTRDQEGKLLGGFSSLNPGASTFVMKSQVACSCKVLACNDVCQKGCNMQCPCSSSQPATTPTKSSGNSIVGMTMLF